MENERKKGYNKKTKYRVCTFLISLIFACTIWTGRVMARDLINLNQRHTLTVEYPCADTSFQIYKVADVSETGSYTLTETFAKYPVVFENMDQTQWRTLALTLEGYIARDDIQPLAEQSTDANGKTTFQDLDAGLYILIGRNQSDSTYRYECEPAMIQLPGLNEKEEWITEVTAKPKYTKQPVSQEETLTQKKVIKIWKDNNSKKRPKEIHVELLKDGKVADTVMLNVDNNWKYQWDNLDSSATWQVVEKEVPQGYRVTVDREADTFTITNVKSTSSKDGNTGTTIGTGTNKTGISGSGKNSRLPQTGQLWCPVGIQSAAGMFFFTARWLTKKNN